MDVELAQQSREVELVPIKVQFILEYSQIKEKVFMFHLQEYMPPVKIYFPPFIRYS